MLTAKDGAFDPLPLGAGLDIPNELELFSIGTSAALPPQAAKTANKTINEPNPIDLGLVKLICCAAPIESNGRGFPAAVHRRGRDR